MNESLNPLPQGLYRTASRIGQIIFTAGMTPRKNGRLIATGAIDCSRDIKEYAECTRLAAANALAAAQAQLKKGERIVQIAKMTVFIASTVSFAQHSKIADFASEYLFETLGECAICSRAAIGVSSLPGNATIEITLIAEVD